MQIQAIISLLVASVYCYEDKYLTQLVYKFIYNNEKLCGDPFYEADWLPAMGECIIDCEPTQYICLVKTVGNNIQKCRELRHVCTMEIRRTLGWTTTFVKASTTTTTTTKPETTTKAVKIDASQQTLNLIGPPVEQVFRNPRQYTTKKLEKITAYDDNVSLTSNDIVSQPTSPAFVIDTTTILPTNSLDSEDVEVAEAYALARPNPTKHMLQFRPINSNNSKGKLKYSFTTTTTTPAPLKPSDRFVKSEELYAQMETEQNAAAKMAHGYAGVFNINDTVDDNWQGNSGHVYGEPQMPSFRPPKTEDLPLVGTRVDIVPPLPPLDPITTTSYPVSAKKPRKSNFESSFTKDLLPNCCEWALNGFCDRNWQRIRDLCPRSCGSLSCEDVEGVQSCTRTIEVDLGDCYQTFGISRYFGVKNLKPRKKIGLTDTNSSSKEKHAPKKIRRKHRKSRKSKKRKLRKIKRKL